jgi:hypothetical protein
MDVDIVSYCHVCVKYHELAYCLYEGKATYYTIIVSYVLLSLAYQRLLIACGRVEIVNEYCQNLGQHDCFGGQSYCKFNKMNFADVRSFSAHTTHSIQIKNVCVNITKLYQWCYNISKLDYLATFIIEKIRIICNNPGSSIIWLHN